MHVDKIKGRGRKGKGREGLASSRIDDMALTGDHNQDRHIIDLDIPRKAPKNVFRNILYYRFSLHSRMKEISTKPPTHAYEQVGSIIATLRCSFRANHGRLLANKLGLYCAVWRKGTTPLL